MVVPRDVLCFLVPVLLLFFHPLQQTDTELARSSLLPSAYVVSQLPYLASPGKMQSPTLGIAVTCIVGSCLHQAVQAGQAGPRSGVWPSCQTVLPRQRQPLHKESVACCLSQFARLSSFALCFCRLVLAAQKVCSCFSWSQRELCHQLQRQLDEGQMLATLLPLKSFPNNTSLITYQA